MWSLRHGLPRRRDESRSGRRPAPAEAGEGQTGRNNVSRLRPVRSRLPERRAASDIPTPTGDHPAQLDPPDRRDGDRTGEIAAPDLRQPRIKQPPGDGGNSRRYPETASRETGHGEPPDEIPLSRSRDRTVEAMRNVAVFGQRWLNRGRPLERWLPVRVKEYPGAKRDAPFRLYQWRPTFHSFQDPGPSREAASIP